ncbi:type II toxin-antitoxin system PemK/MazF family toxin [Streptomyces tubbatahanensis]|uniref:Type II toxin-antitoxin system PemK/MazF family toxin n=1 Tax=Streptomyces tubbatahanensis TaxID=2923272 RepID=A0ABY3XPR9_9ACTN|nr:type II toxin-antitoxin system PemK/MazF family toxin [Streptomyces tubbatahanensis]UNS96405.1 type II toxin-antitoxin system PemK/MazF family toxin [Streptomyces tubbatahanensis]
MGEGPTASPGAATSEVDPRSVGPVRMTYAPDPDGDPDPGEIVWTWVPYEEADGRGKDRPVLIVAREGHGTTGPVLAVQLTSRQHNGDHEWVPLGSGPWDSEGRESWVGLDRVLRVHADGMRREACALDRARFQTVVHRLQQVYGWR